MTHENNPRDGRIVRALRTILGAIAASGEESKRHGQGSTTVGRTRVGYEFSIGTERLIESHQQKRRVTPNQSNRPTAVRYTDKDEGEDKDADVFVTIDASGTDPAAISAGIDDSELLFAVDGTIEERIPLRQQGFEIVTATFTNGILDLRLQSVGIEE